ncbi:hypothetical protein JYU08_00585 [bacterium AH-315-B06]|nr:hypothetical protein [bacterium AH-315-B06]
MRPLSDRQKTFIEYRLQGYPPVISARLAGYPDNGGSQIRVAAHRLEHSENVTNAVCYDALKRWRKGRAVSVVAMEKLAGWKGISERVRGRVRAKLALVA